MKNVLGRVNLFYVRNQRVDFVIHCLVVNFLTKQHYHHRGADVDARNNDGQTALDLSRNDDMEELLVTLKRLVTAKPEDRW
jgi:hypothetical protein